MFRSLSALRRDERGNAIMILAAAMPLIMGAGGLAVDTVSWALKRRDIQRAADSAAIAAASAKQQGFDAETGANEILDRFSQLNLVGEAVVEDGPSAGAHAGNDTAVRVILEAEGRLTFTSLFRSEPIRIRAEATAAVTASPRYCMLSLQDDDTAGITFAGTTDLNLDCGLATNSTGSPAMTVEGSSARIRTTEMSAAGGLAPASNYLGNPKYFPGSPPVADPFEYVDVPPTSACQAARTIGGGANVLLAPGCFSGLDIAGTVSLAPGVYVIKDGPLRFAGNSRVTGTGVTFVMTGSSGSTVSMLTVEGGATLNLTAPSSGDYAGLVFMQDRMAASVVSGVEATNSIAGNASITIKGSLYFPRQRVRVVGTGSLAGSCMRVVAKRIRFTGTSSGFAQSCPSDDDFRAYGTRVRLVD